MRVLSAVCPLRRLARVAGRWGLPRSIRSDNGSEFACEAQISWLKKAGSEPVPVSPGSPWQNGSIELFHSRLRDEFLDRHKFESPADARARASWFVREYNTVRPHSSLGYRPPREFAAACEGRPGEKA